MSSYVRVLLKKGVSKDSKIGFEIESQCDLDTTKDQLIELGKRCIEANSVLMKLSLQGSVQ